MKKCPESYTSTSNDVFSDIKLFHTLTTKKKGGDAREMIDENRPAHGLIRSNVLEEDYAT